MAVKIRPLVLKDAAGYRQCWDTVANERRYITERNAPPLSEVQAQLWRSLREKIPFFVAVDGERVVGFAAVYRRGLPSMSHGGNFGMFLLPEYRGMGLGTKLMAAILKASRSKFDLVFLEVFGKNKVVRKLYEKMGFEPCGRIKNYVKGLVYGFDDALIMQKQIRR